MKALSKNSPVIIEQVTNNTTNWIGHRPGDTNNLISGQTFVSPAEGDLDSIEVLPTMITNPGQVVITVHTFDQKQKSWGPIMGSASIHLNKTDSGKWICFNIPGLHLLKGEAYGFRLESPNTLIGVGEAAGSYNHPPLNNGEEWKFTNKDHEGHSFSYFSLAFKVGLRA